MKQLKKDKSQINVVKCSVTYQSTALGLIGETPQFTVRDIDEDTKAVWIGGGKDWFRKYPVYEEIIQESTGLLNWLWVIQ